jgi:hypothetical protein
MALATSAVTTYSAVGNREDLTDMIYRIDPTDVPFYTGIEREKASATKHEWQTQALAAAAANAQFEGDDSYAADALTATVRLGNYCQILRKTPRVTGTQRVVDHAGRDDEMAYQEMLKGLELKRDVEFALVNTPQAWVSGAAGTARKLANLGAWITTNTAKGGGTAADPTAADGTSARVDSATLTSFTEAALKGVIKKCFDAGGKPTTIMLNSFNKQALSTFVGRGTPIQPQGDRKITAVVDVYESDFSRLKVVPNRFMRQRDVYVLQMDMWAFAPLPGRSFISFPLAKTGDSDAKSIIVEGTLVSRNEKASGGIFDMTTS